MSTTKNAQLKEGEPMPAYITRQGVWKRAADKVQELMRALGSDHPEWDEGTRKRAVLKLHPRLADAYAGLPVDEATLVTLGLLFPGDVLDLDTPVGTEGQPGLGGGRFSASAEVRTKIATYRLEHPEISPEKAHHLVLAAHPDLKEAYAFSGGVR